MQYHHTRDLSKNLVATSYVVVLKLLKYAASCIPMHVVPFAEDPLESIQSQPSPHKGYWIYKNCDLLCAKDEILSYCSACTDYLCQLKRSQATKESRQTKPAHLKASMA